MLIIVQAAEFERFAISQFLRYSDRFALKKYQLSKKRRLKFILRLFYAHQKPVL